MIVEIFGPPGVGKTTLAFELANRLRERGVEAELAVSYRPSEHPLAPRTLSPGNYHNAVRRLTRPALEVSATAGYLFRGSLEASIATTLLRLLPPRSILWSIRLRQYIWRFSHTWFSACCDQRIVIFDQAFVQLLCSLALLGVGTDLEFIEQAIDFVPKPDFLVRLEAPRNILEARLLERDQRLGRIERLLELDLNTNLRSIDIINRLDELLRRRGWSATRVNSTDRHSLRDSLDRLEQAMMARLDAKARAE
jgi:thymidylate kinase